jgi:hypothetical protein
MVVNHVHYHFNHKQHGVEITMVSSEGGTLRAYWRATDDCYARRQVQHSETHLCGAGVVCGGETPGREERGRNSTTHTTVLWAGGMHVRPTKYLAFI